MSGRYFVREREDCQLDGDNIGWGYWPLGGQGGEGGNVSYGQGGEGGNVSYGQGGEGESQVMVKVERVEM